MTIRIEIFGDSAEQALAELNKFAAALTSTPVVVDTYVAAVARTGNAAIKGDNAVAAKSKVKATTAPAPAPAAEGNAPAAPTPAPASSAATASSPATSESPAPASGPAAATTSPSDADAKKAFDTKRASVRSYLAKFMVDKASKDKVTAMLGELGCQALSSVPDDKLDELEAAATKLFG